MKDRLVFKTTKLKNGIRIFSKHIDLPFATIWLYVPVGHIHNTGEVLPGTAHMLEHIAFGRSRLYPEKDRFQKIVELAGGSFNASTCSLHTRYELSVRSDMFNRAFKGLMSHVFEPLITAKDIADEAGIIINESKMYNKWFPGEDRLGNYFQTKWRDTLGFTLRQRVGKREDLTKMSVTKLSGLHEAYFDPRTYLVIGGKFDQRTVIKELGRIKTKKHHLSTKIKQITWVNKKYHEKKFDTIKRYLYYMGGIVSTTDVQTNIAISFIGELLANSTQGVLFEWLRKELGWCYDIDFDNSWDTNPTIYNTWEICLPLSSKKQVAHVRKEIHERILRAISDKALVVREVEREKSSRTFSFETLSSMMRMAAFTLGPHGGKVYTEADYLRFFEKCKDTAYLKRIYDKYWSPKVTGEFLAMPK